MMSKEAISYLLLYILLMVPVAACAAGGTAVGRAIGGKAAAKTNFRCLFISAVCTLVSAVNFYMNIGMLRVISALFFLPLWYVFLLFMSSKSAAACIKHKGVKTMFILYHIFFLASNLMLPDGTSDGSVTFFGLTKNAPTCLGWIAVALFLASLGLMVAQIIVAASLRKNESKDKEIIRSEY